MNAKDLMIGDWVKSRGKIEQVTSVYDGYICTDSFEDSHGYHFKPIPLTPDILEKNGIELSIGPGGLYQGTISGLNCHIEFNIIKYVHQLQHALRLCGIEKEIVL